MNVKVGMRNAEILFGLFAYSSKNCDQLIRFYQQFFQQLAFCNSRFLNANFFVLSFKSLLSSFILKAAVVYPIPYFFSISNFRIPNSFLFRTPHSNLHLPPSPFPLPPSPFRMPTSHFYLALSKVHVGWALPTINCCIWLNLVGNAHPTQKNLCNVKDNSNQKSDSSNYSLGSRRE